MNSHTARSCLPRHALTALIAVVWFLSREVHAAEPAEIENLIRQGIELRKAGRDHRALPFFQKAYDLSATPRTSAQLGLVELALGYSLEAEKHLATALEATRDIWITSNRKVLEGALATARAGIGEVVVAGTPAGATVLANGRPAGHLPSATIRLSEGSARIEVSAEGFVSQALSIAVTPGKRNNLEIQLATVQKTPGPNTGAQETASTGQRPDSGPPRNPESVELTPHEAKATLSKNEPTQSRWDAIRTTGVASAVLGAASLGFGIFASLKVRATEQDVDRLLSTEGYGSVDASEVEAKIVTGERYRKLQWVGYGMAAVSTAVSAACLIVASTSPGQEGRTLGLAPFASPEGQGGTIWIRF